jgi:phage terminase large subunit-like protein
MAGGRTFWSTGGKVIRFIETACLLTNGRWTGEKFVLMSWQKRLIAELFEVDPGTGWRIYRRALIGLPRKSGKTEVLAAILLYLMLADGEKSAAVYCAAASEDQADMVFDAMKRMCELPGAPLAELVDVQVSRLSKHGDPYSFAQRLTSKGRTKHGLNPFAVGLDELHAWGVGEGEELWAALNTGSAARQEPMQIAITTAGLDLEESRCGQMYKLGRSIERGEIEHGGFFFRWWQAPEGMDHRDPEYPRLASPSYGHTVNEGFYRSELSVPEAVFRRLYGNEWVDYGESPWVTRDQIKACRLEPFQLVAGDPTWVGIDLSETRDSTATVWGQWRPEAGRPCGHTAAPCLYIHVRTWEQPRGPDGRLREEWEVPQGEVKQHLRDLASTYDVVTNVFDPWHSKLMRQDLEAEGLTCEEIHQTGARRSGASAGLFDLIIQKRLHYCDDVFERHVLNATARETGTDGGYYLAKRRKGKVMDAAMAAVNVTYGTQFAGKQDGGIVMWIPPKKEPA